MKIELWSDYACPFCYIGEKRLEKALAEIDGGDKVEIEFKSFELDPYASRGAFPLRWIVLPRSII